MNISEEIKNFNKAFQLARFDLKSQGSRTLLSTAWITLGFGIFVGAKSYIFSKLLGENFIDYIIYLSCSLGLWYFLAGLMNGGCSVYRGKGIQKMLRFPEYYFFYYMVIRKIIDLFLQLIIFIMFLFISLQFNSNLFLFFINLIFILIVMSPFSLNIASISIFSKDFVIMVGYITRVLFFLTPVIWSVDMIDLSYSSVYFYNPFFHLIELLRDPLLGKELSLMNYKYCLIFFAINLIIYIFILRKYVKNHALYI